MLFFIAPTLTSYGRCCLSAHGECWLYIRYVDIILYSHTDVIRRHRWLHSATPDYAFHTLMLRLLLLVTPGAFAPPFICSRLKRPPYVYLSAPSRYAIFSMLPRHTFFRRLSYYWIFHAIHALYTTRAPPYHDIAATAMDVHVFALEPSKAGGFHYIACACPVPARVFTPAMPATAPRRLPSALRRRA